MENGNKEPDSLGSPPLDEKKENNNTIQLPVVDKPFVYVSDKGMAWFGLPLDIFRDPLTAMTYLDSMKLQIINWFNKMELKNKSRRPNFIQNVRGFLARKY